MVKRILTAIIVNDNNNLLEKIADELESKMRVFRRTSLEGEKLYGYYEGISIFDATGNKCLVRYDSYDDVLERAEDTINKLDADSRALLNEYLKGLKATKSEDDHI